MKTLSLTLLILLFASCKEKKVVKSLTGIGDTIWVQHPIAEIDSTRIVTGVKYYHLRCDTVYIHDTIYKNKIYINKLTLPK